MLFVLSSLALAVVYGGNPHAGVRVDRPANDYVHATVWLDRVDVHHCDGSTQPVVVDEEIDAVSTTWVAVPTGDLCALTFVWSSSMTIEGDTFMLSYEGQQTTVVLDDPIAPVALTPYTVLSGSHSGSPPWLLVDVQ